MILICETCHRHWSAGRKRQKTCPRCNSRNRRAAQLRRARLRQIAREARREALPDARCPTPEELRKLMDDADAKAARALETARTIAARFRPVDA